MLRVKSPRGAGDGIKLAASSGPVGGLCSAGRSLLAGGGGGALVQNLPGVLEISEVRRSVD